MVPHKRRAFCLPTKGSGAPRPGAPWSAGVKVGDTASLTTVEALDSTNATLMAWAEQGAPAWTVLRAMRQTRGRGREGRPWVSQYGNLYLSLLLRPKIKPQRWAEISFVAGLAVAEAVDRHTPRRVWLKWPNDVLLDDKKLAGILIESAGSDGLVIGIGVNVASAPPDDDVHTPATALAPGRETPTAAILADEIVLALERWVNRWTVHGFDPVRSGWLSLAKGLGETVNVAAGSGRETGVFETIDADGALILLQGSKKSRILAGDVLFPGDRA